MAKNFAVREYEVETKKIEGAFSIALVSDVHGKVYGEDNEPVAQALAAMDPDFILLPGDLVSAEREETDEPAVRLVERLAKVAPLFISPGNHERALRYKKLKYGNGRYDALRKAFAEAGARFLSNSSTFADNGEESARLTGLDLPLWKYTKFKRPELSAEELHERLGKSDGRHFQILLAHNPAFIDQYFEWGADLVVSGHVPRRPRARRGDGEGLDGSLRLRAPEVRLRPL